MPNGSPLVAGGLNHMFQQTMDQDKLALKRGLTTLQDGRLLMDNCRLNNNSAGGWRIYSDIMFPDQNSK